METIQNLLSQVSTIVQQYEKVAELTGENFNSFVHFFATLFYARNK